MADKVQVSTCGHVYEFQESWLMLPQNLNRIHLYHSGSPSYVINDNKFTVKPEYIYFFPQNLGFKPKFSENEAIDHEWIDFITVPLVFGKSVIEISPDDQSSVANALRLCVSLARNLYKNDDLNGKQLLENAVQLTLDCMQAEKIVQLGGNVRINQALSYIHKHYAEEITLETLSDKAYCAKNHLVRLFKKEIGITPYQYIKNYRMGLATDLLSRGYSVKETAGKVGYGDGYTFSAAFYKTFKVYPTTYVKKIKK
ncbi:MAG: helix-turn-helix transcriptional regulator [Clostridia bacterium]|nr:helix-turn-helix transcriptional regulator [Clostridia bacterium]